MTSNADIRRVRPADMVIGAWPAPDGWPLRRFDWPAPDHAPLRGSMLFLGGRGDFIEKYLESLHHWHACGWALAGFDWRGQGGSGRLLADAAIGHIRDFAPLVDDLAAFVDAWLAATPAPHVAVAHSMGGHLLLRLLAERHPRFDAVILVAPMLGFAPAPLPPWATRWVVRAARWIGRGGRPAWSEGHRPDLIQARRRLNLTHCPDRYADEGWWRAAAPEIMVGPPTWGWLGAAFASIDRLGARGLLEGVATPLLLLCAPHDRLVSAAAIRRAAARLPDARLIEYEEGAHELLREVDSVRLAALAAIDSFLDARAPLS